jgi:RND family efflux transporter MFP subunit
MKRPLFFLVLGFAVLTIAGCTSLPTLSANTTTTKAQQTVTVTRGSIVATVNAAGNVITPEDASLAFSSSGKVAKVNVQVGDRVKSGQVLMELDTTDLTLSLRNTQAQLANSQANLESVKTKNSQNINQLIVAKLQVDKTILALNQAQSAYDNIAWRGDVSSTSQAATLANAKTDYQNALANYQITATGINDTAVRQAQASVDKDQIAVEQAQRNIDKTKILAPFNGVVSTVNFGVGDTVGTGVAVIVIDDTKLQVKPNVAEVDVAKIALGQTVQMSFDALSGNTYPGKVIAIAPQATVTQGVVNFPVTIAIDNSNGDVKPGMTANATIQIERRDNVLMIPTRAVRTQGNQKTVTVLYKGQSIALPVSTGLSNESSIELTGGELREGDVLLINQTTTTTGGGGGGGIGIPGMGAMFGGR